MTRRETLCQPVRRAALGLALVAVVGGCQQVDQLVRNPLGRHPTTSGATLADYRQSKSDSRASRWGQVLDRGQRADIQFAVGRSLEQRGETRDAVETYQEVLRKDARHAGALHRLAVLHDKQGKSDKAHPLYLEALLLDPSNAELHCDAGYSCYLAEQWDDAEQHLRRAIELDDRLTRAHNNLGLLLARLDRNNEALQAFVQGGSDAATARANLGVASLAGNRLDTARRQFKLALRSDPEHELALQGMHALRALAEESGAAATLAANRVDAKAKLAGTAAKPSEGPIDETPDNDVSHDKRDHQPSGETLIADVPRQPAPRVALRLPAVNTVGGERDDHDSSRVVWATPTDDDTTEVVPAAPYGDGTSPATPASPGRLPADVNATEARTAQSDVDRDDRLPVMQLR